METNKNDSSAKTNSFNLDSRNKGINTDKFLERTAHDVGARVGEFSSNFVDKTSGYVKNGREYVTENPIKGVAIAAVAGAMVGSLFTLSMRRRH